jgi:hypothetical protein
LNVVITDAIRHYQRALAQASASGDEPETAGAGQPERLSTSKRSDQERLGEQVRQFACGERADAER